MPSPTDARPATPIAPTSATPAAVLALCALASTSEVARISPSFNSALTIQGIDALFSSDVGVVLLRELLDRMDLVEEFVGKLEDPRDPKLIDYSLAELISQTLAMLTMGLRNQDDADFLRADASLRLAMGERQSSESLKNIQEIASQPTVSRLIGILATEKNRNILEEFLTTLAIRCMLRKNGGKRLESIEIDMDSLPIEVYGDQPGAEYNGHYQAMIYHPLVAFAGGYRSILTIRLRKGNVASADGDVAFIAPLIARIQAELSDKVLVRFDAGFPDEELLGNLEKIPGVRYVTRIKDNAVLSTMASPHLKSPQGRRPAGPRMFLHEKEYQAKAWSCRRRAILVVQEVPNELFHHCFWLITNWSKEEKSSAASLASYRKRGSAENSIGELKSVLQPKLPSSPRPKSHYRGRKFEEHEGCDGFSRNIVNLLLYSISYNILNALRDIYEEVQGRGFSLKTVKRDLLRGAGRFIQHARKIVLVINKNLAELWGQVINKMNGYALQQV